MDFLQQKIFNPTDFKPPAVKSGAQGFASLLLLPIMALMITALMGLSSLSLGIKNITKAQSYCIQTSLQGQKELGALLKKILALNTQVKSLHKTRKAVSAAIIAAVVTGALPLLPFLNKKKEFVKKAQKALRARQNYLLARGFFIKRKTLKALKRKLKTIKAFHVREEAFYKKALAVKQKKIGDEAYIYEPMPDFVNHQKSRFIWSLPLFYPLDFNARWLLPAGSGATSNHTCTASLKQEGDRWISALYH